MNLKGAIEMPDANGLTKSPGVLLVGALIGCLMIGHLGCATRQAKAPSEAQPTDSKASQAGSKGLKTRDPLPVKPAYIAMTEPVTLRLLGEVGRTELARNCSATHTKTFEKGRISHERVEGVDFEVESKTVSVDGDRMTQEVRTVSKDGTVPLHSFALPEYGETLELITNSQAKVFKAGNYPKESIFFVPPIPLPDHPVKVGESWVMKVWWLSEQSTLRLSSKVTATLLGVQPCGESTCADVEMKGSVLLDPPVNKKGEFNHSLRGRYLLELKRGLLVWGEFQSTERLQAPGARVEVSSVLRSHLVEPRGYHTLSRAEPACPLETTAE
jgi:hypothetical protein